MSPSRNNGKVCYIEIPSVDIDRSVTFYQAVFDWKVRTRGNGTRAFDDSVGSVSGTWVKGRPPMREVGLLVYIMVDSVEATVASVVKNGGESVYVFVRVPLFRAWSSMLERRLFVPFTSVTVPLASA